MPPFLVSVDRIPARKGFPAYLTSVPHPEMFVLLVYCQVKAFVKHLAAFVTMMAPFHVYPSLVLCKLFHQRRRKLALIKITVETGFVMSASNVITDVSLGCANIAALSARVADAQMLALLVDTEARFQVGCKLTLVAPKVLTVVVDQMFSTLVAV